MLTILTAQPVHPEVETIDRDPGIITLLAALVRSARRSAGGRAGEGIGLFASATAWPHNAR
ncbi:hypothetical protein [Methylorubrum suomiense]|uniref:Uncharacterized protein n=1 Tax=Methylorubrum suomiense TaxID=144191 RepID=A0ABQ4UPR2_9HYPH|nr:MULTISPECIES: hypothetical protein [Methylobacteriaceae]GJE73615.1 hypothetical protein BGCPKDLD_0181 [Methylorubrum suomiense]